MRDIIEEFGGGLAMAVVGIAVVTFFSGFSLMIQVDVVRWMLSGGCCEVRNGRGN